MKSSLLLFCLALVVFNGCTNWAPTRAGEPYTHTSKRMMMTLPAGWYRHTPSSGDRLVLTRQGLPLGVIEADRWRLDRIPLEHTQRRIEEGMNPLDAADVVLGNLRSNPALAGLEVLETGPVTVNEREGFRLRVSYRPVGGARRQREVWGVLDGDAYGEVTYDAPAQVYFDAHYDEFVTAASSVRLR